MKKVMTDRCASNRWDCSIVIRSVKLAVIALQLIGCSEIIPGLNVKVDKHESNKYRVVQIEPEILKSLAQDRATEYPQALLSTVPTDIPAEYTIGAGDIVYVTVWDHPELTTPSGPVTEVAALAGQTQTQFVQGRLVNADGTIFFPYVGTFKIAQMTTLNARSYIAQNLSRVIANPQVDVRIVAFRAARVEVAGEVVKPGTVTLDDTPKGILQALNLSGGLTANASRRRALLVRNGVTYRIDLAGLLSGEKPVSNPLLFAGDVLHIPDQSDDQVFVLGAVPKQAPVIIRQSSISLIEALTNAGGIEELRGKQSGVLVFRMKQSDSERIPTVYALDLSRPDGMLLAGEFALRPRDVVYVQATAFAQYNSVIATLLPTVSTIFELHQLTK
jgi:polysaccharide export outer membrane protein